MRRACGGTIDAVVVALTSVSRLWKIGSVKSSGVKVERFAWPAGIAALAAPHDFPTDRSVASHVTPATLPEWYFADSAVEDLRLPVSVKIIKSLCFPSAAATPGLVTDGIFNGASAACFSRCGC